MCRCCFCWIILLHNKQLVESLKNYYRNERSVGNFFCVIRIAIFTLRTDGKKLWLWVSVKPVLFQTNNNNNTDCTLSKKHTPAHRAYTHTHISSFMPKHWAAEEERREREEKTKKWTTPLFNRLYIFLPTFHLFWPACVCSRSLLYLSISRLEISFLISLTKKSSDS